MVERVKFQFFDSEWAKKHALFSSDEMCEVCDLPLPHGPIFHTDEEREGKLLDIRLRRIDRAMTALQRELHGLNELRERHCV